MSWATGGWSAHSQISTRPGIEEDIIFAGQEVVRGGVGYEEERGGRGGGGMHGSMVTHRSPPNCSPGLESHASPQPVSWWIVSGLGMATAVSWQRIKTM